MLGGKPKCSVNRQGKESLLSRLRLTPERQATRPQAAGMDHQCHELLLGVGDSRAASLIAAI
jgi:hypothetical protein